MLRRLDWSYIRAGGPRSSASPSPRSTTGVRASSSPSRTTTWRRAPGTSSAPTRCSGEATTPRGLDVPQLPGDPRPDPRSVRPEGAPGDDGRQRGRPQPPALRRPRFPRRICLRDVGYRSKLFDRCPPFPHNRATTAENTESPLRAARSERRAGPPPALLRIPGSLGRRTRRPHRRAGSLGPWPVARPPADDTVGPPPSVSSSSPPCRRPPGPPPGTQTPRRPARPSPT